MGSVLLSAIYPRGGGARVSLGPAKPFGTPGTWEAAVPLKDGCAMVLASLSAAAAPRGGHSQ